MQIYNTMTRKKEELVPINPGKIGMYVCGPTVYNFFHIGNARPFVVFDTMRRYLEYLGYDVTFVQNFTDIDDKLIRKANEENSTVPEIAERFIKEYYVDADALGVERASCNPRATEHIDEIIALVQKLIDAGHAYAADNGDVYFSVRSYPAYGKLSGQSIESLESGARIDPTEQKRDPLDFALWKGAKPNEPSWDTPWGKGRPGWHIECSAMSMNILGETFDIHAGGQDLIFPHHENEIAQSEASTGKPFAKYWMHNGYINVNNQKMSKSLGNFLLVRDIAKEFDLEAVRMFLLSAHYRNPVNFSRDLVEQASTGLARLKTARERLENAPVAEVATAEDADFIAAVDNYKKSFCEAMDDDLNTADALGVLFEYARAVNTFVSTPSSKEALEKAKELFDSITSIFSILRNKESDTFPEEALALLNERSQARADKNWARADEIREQLKEMGFAVEDSKEGAKLKKI
ncbi:MAG: cysteine--tRNA ligase [Clostridia bacterium]|nr:cysteine--tRNA ligase [Clostridia bacterium]